MTGARTGERAGGPPLPGPACLKLTAYFAERQRAGHRFLGDALVSVCERHGLRASVLLRGAEGFGRHLMLQTDRLLSLSEDLPMVLVAVDEADRLQAALPDLGDVAGHGLLTLERASMPRGPAPAASQARALGDEVKLTVYCGRGERAAGGRPLFVEVIERAHRLGLRTGTVLLGVDGTIAGTRTRARFVGSNAAVPLMIILVGAVDVAVQLLDQLHEQMERPLVTLERIRVCKAAGRVLAGPHAPAGFGAGGLGAWVKLMVHAGHDARPHGRPLFIELVRRLRAAGAGGATVLHGIWGWDGDRRPGGDRLLSLRRHVPTLTVVVDTPDRAARWFELIDDLTDGQGVVTSELVPALRARGVWGRSGGLRLASLAHEGGEADRAT